MIKNQSHKKIAILFLSLITSGKIDEAYEKYVSSDFRHHNPYFRGNAESLSKGMKENELKFPHKTFKIKHAFADKDFVIVHSHVKLISGEMEFTTVHILRFKGDKIIEVWDITQQIPKNSLNENGMF